MILIVGIGNSGTSFLTNLMSELGYNCGREKDLKKGDSHNKKGYYENLILRNLIWEKINLNCSFFCDKYLQIPKIQDENFSQKYIKLIKENKINCIKEFCFIQSYEIYKDNFDDLKVIIANRDIKETYNSVNIKISFDQYEKNHKKFYEINKKILEMNNIPYIEIFFDMFKNNKDINLEKISNFLNKDISEIKDIFTKIYYK